MPKCANVVILVIVTNIVTLTIFSNIKYEKLPSLSEAVSIIPGYSNSGGQNGGVEHISSPSALIGGFSQPQPQPNQLSSNSVIQTGRVIQSVIEDNSQQLAVASTTVVSKVEETKPFVSIFQKRKQILNEVCEQTKKNPREPLVNDPSHLFILQDRGISWCPVFKAGSSTWLAFTLELSSKSPAVKAQIKKNYNGNFLQQGRQAAPTMSRSSFVRYKTNMRRQNKTEISLIIVRHPFERLVSAYRDKLERTHKVAYLKDFYYKTYGKKIVAKFRTKAIQKFGDEFFSAKNNYGAPLPVKDNGRPSSDLPIFWEFVQFVIESRKGAMDEHWKPTFNYCSMCVLNYDYVIKFEDYLNEAKAFLKTSNLNTLANEEVLEEAINPNRPGEMSSSDITEKYFGMLSDEDIHKLYQVYQEDFRLFNYTFTYRKMKFP